MFCVVLRLWYVAMVGKHLRNVDCRGHSCNARCWDGILKVAILALTGFFMLSSIWPIFWPRKRNLRRYQWVSWKVWRTLTTLTQDPGSYPKKSHPSNEQRSWFFRGFVGYEILPSHISTIINYDNEPYCWWKKSCTTWDVKFLLDNPINHQSTGAGVLPSTLLNNQYNILESIRPFFFCHGSLRVA